ncbi:hypothetical protein FYN05_05255 [Lactobacillus salivarius]|uniref:hypothetical protein n=1 Tax=Ligilactobacillus salivarius TaxID=1624 RepID=UPI0013704337|nr:hypothetical protein [Ligilactobacillus salivarius]MYU72631.1 hypothetical protein [Ligilactobacillus salivarius]MYV21229.1 hypothetical protein [Ligilactobacillus salivarius]MYY31460.1 hypothetical protein [Ligilactobacillus salivarius]MYY89106.1 hypothetical protein [Ligilactobacillus salivarius]MYZ69095.1 hypothetical protein [Ligilactobacillus salivarius]
MELKEIIARLKSNYDNIIEDRDNKERLKDGLNEYQYLIQVLQRQYNDEYNMKIARQLTDIAENIQALVKLMALVSISNSDDAKAYFMNETLTHVLDSLCNSIDDITNLSDSLVDLD